MDLINQYFDLFADYPMWLVGGATLVVVLGLLAVAWKVLKFSLMLLAALALIAGLGYAALLFLG